VTEDISNLSQVTGDKTSKLTEVNPIDTNATDETKTLYRNLHALAGNYTLFGHQDALAYGYKWWAEPGRCDVKEVCGAYPSVFGWDVGHPANKAPADEQFAGLVLSLEGVSKLARERGKIAALTETGSGEIKNESSSRPS